MAGAPGFTSVRRAMNGGKWGNVCDISDFSEAAFAVVDHDAHDAFTDMVAEAYFEHLKATQQFQDWPANAHSALYDAVKIVASRVYFGGPPKVASINPSTAQLTSTEGLTLVIPASLTCKAVTKRIQAMEARKAVVVKIRASGSKGVSPDEYYAFNRAIPGFALPEDEGTCLKIIDDARTGWLSDPSSRRAARGVVRAWPDRVHVLMFSRAASHFVSDTGGPLDLCENLFALLSTGHNGEEVARELLAPVL